MVAWASGRQRQAALALGGANEPQMPPHPRKYQGKVWRYICIGGQRHICIGEPGGTSVLEGRGRKGFWHPEGENVWP